MDGVEGKTGRVRLDYPFAEAPEPARLKEVAPGVFWLRMPLPFSLKFINLWLLEDGDGWTLVDTGISDAATRELWEQLFDGDMAGRPIRRVIVTHMHPDHVGLAGWLTRRFDCRLWMTRLEYISCRMLVADTGREAPEDGVRFYRAAGWDEAAIANYRARFGGFGRAVSSLPDAYRRLEEGDALDIGGRTWRIVTGSGHSPHHACLHCPEHDLFISGDQILPRISSNVSVFPTEPDADPLSDWLASCERLQQVVSDDTLILPAHNEPFRGGVRRLKSLVDGHELSLRRLLDRLAEPATAVDCFGPLFVRPITPDIIGMATGEAMAHLNCLVARGLAERIVEGGKTLYRRAT